MKKFLNTLIAASWITACGNSHPAAVSLPNRTDSSNQTRAVPELGQLGNTAKQLTSSPSSDSCDADLQNFRNEISLALDAHKDDLLAAEKMLPPSKNYQLVSFGDSELKEYIGPKSTSSNWITVRYGWQMANEHYQKIKDQPVSISWISLKIYAQDLLWDDSRRLNDQANYSLNKDSKDSLLSLKNAVSNCNQSLACQTPCYQSADLAFIQTVPNYLKAKNDIDQESSLSKKRLLIENFLQRLSNDFHYYDFIKNKTLQLAVDPNTQHHNYTLPLNADAFSDDQKVILRKTIEDTWKNTDHSLQISWNHSSALLGLFKVFFDPPLAKAPSLDRTDRFNFEVHLFPKSSLKAVAHEIGHVMGFPDHYYTFWDPLTCTYSKQKRNDDLMSTQDTGSVTDEEWKELYENYQT